MNKKTIIVLAIILTVFIAPVINQGFKCGSKVTISAVPSLFAAKGGKGKGKGADKEKKPKKDKGKGPSVPGLPMVSAVVIGLAAIGAGRFFLKKKK